jgi:hypothetical protein
MNGSAHYMHVLLTSCWLTSCWLRIVCPFEYNWWLVVLVVYPYGDGGGEKIRARGSFLLFDVDGTWI